MPAEHYIFERAYFLGNEVAVEVRIRKPTVSDHDWPKCDFEMDYKGKKKYLSTSGSDPLDAFLNAIRIVRVNIECWQNDDNVLFRWVAEPGVLGLPISYD